MPWLKPESPAVILALLPPFIDPQAALSPTSQIVFIGGESFMSCAAVYFLDLVRKVLGTRPVAARVVSRVSGGIDDVDYDDFIVRTVLCLS